MITGLIIMGVLAAVLAAILVIHIILERRHTMIQNERWMKGYTLQKDLDFLGLGQRWGCAFMGPLNALEHTRGRKLNEGELDGVVGHAFRNGYAHLCNYIDHKNLKKKAADCKRWDEADNPEWHYYVSNRQRFVNYLEAAFNITIQHNRYKVAIMKTQYGGLHYCLKTSVGELINPDPSLKGPIIEVKPFIY